MNSSFFMWFFLHNLFHMQFFTWYSCIFHILLHDVTCELEFMYNTLSDVFPMQLRVTHIITCRKTYHMKFMWFFLKGKWIWYEACPINYSTWCTFFKKLKLVQASCSSWCWWWSTFPVHERGDSFVRPVSVWRRNTHWVGVSSSILSACAI